MAGVDLILKDLSVGYPRQTLLSGLDVSFSAGTLTALVGRNGTGKSTLLRVMAGLAKPLTGEVLVKGEWEIPLLWRGGSRKAADGVVGPVSSMPPPLLAQTIGFVSTERIRITNLRVRDLVALGRTPYTDWIGNLTPQDIAAVDEALALTGMSGFADKAMETLSDGEAQRVMIARVLAQDTPVILLDEPTAFLDFVARREVCELLSSLAREKGKTIIFPSHDLALVDEFADARLEIADKKAVKF